jgi:hypothetical protein
MMRVGDVRRDDICAFSEHMRSKRIQAAVMRT